MHNSSGRKVSGKLEHERGEAYEFLNILKAQKSQSLSFEEMRAMGKDDWDYKKLQQWSRHFINYEVQGKKHWIKVTHHAVTLEHVGTEAPADWDGYEGHQPRN